jgi:hypothetical protein
MKRYFGFVLAIFLTAAGCGSSPSPSSSSRDQTATDSAAPVAAASTDDASMPAPPPGALYTLHCATFSGPTHIADATRSKELLIRSTGSKDWYVVHSAEESDLYFGYYKTFDDRSQLAEYTRAQTDRARVSSLMNQDGDPVFPEVVFTSINTPDPPAPKEWDLASNPGYWTLQIAVYKGSPERKQAAVDAVREFRAHGIEAYFRHGPATSEVYIGSWPRQAVREQQASVAQGDDPNQWIMVSPGPLPQGVDADKLYDSQGRKVKVVMPNLQIVDPSLKLAAQQYPYYYVNGEVVGRRTQTKDRSWQTIPWPSYLVQVPHDNDDQEQPTKSDSDRAGAPPQGDTGDSTPTVPGLGGLR